MTPGYLTTAAEWGANAAFWSATAFPVVSAIVWPWWKSFWGVNIVTLEIAISLALLGPVLSEDLGFHMSDLMFAWVEVVVLWLVSIITVWRGFLVVSTQVKGAFNTSACLVTRALARYARRRGTRAGA